MKYIILAILITIAVVSHDIVTDKWEIQITDLSLLNGYNATVMPGAPSEFSFAGGTYNVEIGESRWTTSYMIATTNPDVSDWLAGIFDSDSLWATQEEAEDGDGLRIIWETRVRHESYFAIFSHLMIIENEADTAIHFTPNTLIDLHECDSLPIYLYSSMCCTLGTGDYDPVYLSEPLDSAILEIHQDGGNYSIYTTVHPADPAYVLIGDWRDLLGHFGGYDSLVTGSMEDMALAIQWNDILIDAVSTDTVGIEFAVIDSGASITERDMPESHDLKIFPNPFNSSVKINVGTYCNTPPQIAIYDIQGCLVDELRPGANAWQPDETVTSGVYLIKANIGDYSITRRALYIR